MLTFKKNTVGGQEIIREGGAKIKNWGAKIKIGGAKIKIGGAKIKIGGAMPPMLPRWRRTWF